MSLKANPLTRLMHEHFRVLTELGFVSFVDKLASEDSMRAINSSLREIRKQLNAPRTGVHIRSYCLPVPTLTGTEYAQQYTRGIGSADEHLVSVLNELGARMQAQILVSAFEQLERNIRSLAAAISRSQPQIHLRMTPKLREFKLQRSKSKRSGPHEGTPPFFREYVEWRSQHNCKELLSCLGKAFPELSSRYVSNPRGIHLLEFFEMLNLCRQQVVHAGGVIGSNEIRKLPKGWSKLIEENAISESVISGRQMILPGHNFVRYVCEFAAAFGLLIYKVASDSLGFKDELSGTSLPTHD